jgi:hypothetical protein
MLFNNAASTTCYVVKGGGKITRFLGCYAMWAGKLLQAFRQHYSPRSTFSFLVLLLVYCTTGAFTMTGSVSILILSNESRGHFRNETRTASNTNPDRAHHTKRLDADDTALLIYFYFSGSVAQRGLWPPRITRFLVHTRRDTVGRTPLGE